MFDVKVKDIHPQNLGGMGCVTEMREYSTKFAFGLSLKTRNPKPFRNYHRGRGFFRTVRFPSQLR